MQYLIKYIDLSTATGKVYLSIYYDELNNWIYNKWVGYVTPENVRQGLLAVLEALETFKTPIGLNDNSGFVGRWNKSVDWIEKVWIPQAVEAGLRYYAMVVNKHALAVSSAYNMKKRAEGKFTMRIFDNISEATAWLKSCAQKIT